MSAYNSRESVSDVLSDAILGAEADFWIEIESYPAEPFRWGGSRGQECDVLVRMSELHLDGRSVSRDVAVAFLGSALIEELEATVADRARSEMHGGLPSAA